ncbi:aurora kinase A and ninein-interacting protein [Pimephales promelas]|uniref:aurora kinase A and ninein-interacting protein n=1 Tax=Pimephales promelas TaxID=90988 RepID=UPI0019556338|nr:aurora kinase A and ninein-interacting protein [Pimephales promelas]KAG1946838.1 hypothetical protein F2P79_012886 [Pimephales promelas]KAG1946839.1 hypothetical protein F2P79_012886 [Pimephales promelas]KAG1946840.1 hypothetical protein F2P79_012886 [Pimephales promelas]KAG1946841.1 hypothetical protein F2P79_012886 [Pimephales promelas]KAG1946842.1 hypothetical protein F2P79_012886 [Pimephales promelas]
MKSSKSTKAKPAKEEECGIWLDTKELKEKKQQLRPKSRLVFSSLALSFTQTKLHMPVTRQSVISSFFTHTHTDPNRSATHTGNKRKHDMTSDSTRPTSELDLQNWDGDCEGSSDKDQKEQRFFHLIGGEESEAEEPPKKRRHVAHYTQEHDQSLLKTQEHQNKEENPNKRVPETQPFFHGGQKATVKGHVLTSRPVNQTHERRSARASPLKRMGKENARPYSSPAKKRYTLPSPEKCVSAGETVALLFTQDSEGLCVIAHRDQHSLKERTHTSEDKSDGCSVCASVKEEDDDDDDDEEEEVLFTQDSEGNMVIKH